MCPDGNFSLSTQPRGLFIVVYFSGMPIDHFSGRIYILSNSRPRPRLKVYWFTLFYLCNKKNKKKNNNNPLEEKPFHFLDMKISFPSTDVYVYQEEGGNAEKVVI